MEKYNKTKMIEQYLLDGNTITSLETIERFGATRLSAVIFNLRKKYVINNEWIDVKDRWGNDCRVVEYTLVGILNNENN